MKVTIGFSFQCWFDSAGKLALDKLAAFPNLTCSQQWPSSKDEIDSLNLRGLFGSICLWLQAQ
jgi:hypothetical protein